MKLYDQEAQDLARVVQDVLEGKKPLTEMDPAKHVEQNKDTGMFCVYNKAGKKVKEFKDKADAVKYATDNHDELMETETGTTSLAPTIADNKSDGKPLAKDPRDVKGIHKNVKVTKGPGVKEDINAAHEEALAIEEARQLKDPKKEVMVVKNGKVEVIDKKDLKKFMAKGYGLAENTITISLPALFNEKKATIDLDFADGGDKEMKRIEKKYKVKYKERKDGGFDVTGDTKNLHKLLKGPEYAYDKDDIEDMFPEVLEAKDVKEEQSDKQKKYRAFFDKALKKFGVKSPAELEGDKKKEFFDYVDANYEADNESD